MRSRLSTCARCRPSTGRRSPSPCATRAVVSSCMRHRRSLAWVPNLPHVSPNVVSTTCRLLCCGWAASPLRILRRGWKSISCPISIACSMQSTVRSDTEARPCRSSVSEPPEADVASLKQFKLPVVGKGLTEAEVVRWLVKVGDRVAQNQTIVEIETAKALVELPSPFAGVVSELLIPEGTTIDVGTPIIIIDIAPTATAAPNAESANDAAGAVAAASAIPARTPNLVGYGPRADSPVRRRVRQPVTAPAGPTRPARDWPSV